MNEERMLHLLEEHHRTIEAGLAKTRRHCGATDPCSRELGAVREELTAASLVRSRFVSEQVVPSLLRNADDGLREDLSELLYATAAKRMLSNGHIKTWTMASIEADWSGYCAAARDLWPMMEDQMEHERRVLITRLVRQ